MMSISKQERGLPTGLLMAFTAVELKRLRATRGDPARRQFIVDRATSTENTLRLDDAWQFIEHLVGEAVFASGTSLHKGQMSRLRVLAPDALTTGLNQLPHDQVGLRKRFDQMNERAFHYRFVPFWTKDKWTAAGLKTVKTPARREHVVTVVTAARVFVDATLERGEHVLFFCDYRESP